MLRFDGEVFRFGTAMAETFPEQFHAVLPPGKTGGGGKPNPGSDARALCFTKN